MHWHVAQIKQPVDQTMKVTQACFIIIGGPVWTVLEARDIVEDQVKRGGREDWFIIIQTYPTRNEQT